MSKLVAKIPLLIEASKPKLREFNRFAKVELYPPTPAELPQVFSGFAKLARGAKAGNWKTVTMKQALINTCITVEVLCWFFVGEVIGKRNLIGYDV